MLSSEFSTVKELIERAATQSKASPTFLASVLELFRTKGISLESRAEPYAEMIERAFSSHGAQRETFTRIQTELSELTTTLKDLQRAWLELAGKTREIEEVLRRRQAGANAAKPSIASVGAKATPPPLPRQAASQSNSASVEKQQGTFFGMSLIVGSKLLPN